jgi:hypothetical protein
MSNCLYKIFFSSLSQQKLMRKKFFCCKKILLILNNQKMKNLQELSLNEMREVEGGNLGLAIVLIIIVAYYMTRENDRDK